MNKYSNAAMKLFSMDQLLSDALMGNFRATDCQKVGTTDIRFSYEELYYRISAKEGLMVAVKQSDTIMLDEIIDKLEGFLKAEGISEELLLAANGDNRENKIFSLYLEHKTRKGW